MPRKIIPNIKPLTGATPVAVVEATEPWATYKLADGTTIRAKLRVESFFVWPGQYDMHGNPVYSNQTMIVFEHDVPEHLKEKP